MSIDTSHARPTSPVSSAGTLSAWDAKRIVLDAERATRNAATRRELDAHQTKPRTVADVEADIRRYTRQETAPAVIHCLPWLYDVQAKLAAAEAELATMQAGGAR